MSLMEAEQSRASLSLICCRLVNRISSILCCFRTLVRGILRVPGRMRLCACFSTSSEGLQVKTKSIELTYFLLQDADSIICQLGSADVSRCDPSSLRMLSRICEVLEFPDLGRLVESKPIVCSLKENRKWVASVRRSFASCKANLYNVLDGMTYAGSAERLRLPAFDAARFQSANTIQMLAVVD